MVSNLSPANRELLGFRLGIQQNQMPDAEHIERLASNLIAFQRQDQTLCDWTYQHHLQFPFAYIHAAINALVEKLMLSTTEATSHSALQEELFMHTMAERLQSIFEEAYGLQ